MNWFEVVVFLLQVTGTAQQVNPVFQPKTTAPSASFVEFSGAAEEITAGPDGAMWTTGFSQQIGRITTDSIGDVTTYSTTSCCTLGAIATGSDGALWFTETTQIGRITTSGAYREYQLPKQDTLCACIALGPDGALWFGGSASIWRITTAGAFTQYPIPTPASSPQGITAGPDGAIWFTESAVNQIGRITVEGVITEYTIATPNSQPVGISAGPDGALWFTEVYANQIGRISATGAITEYAVPTPHSLLNGIAMGLDGALWFAEGFGGNLGRITTEGVITEYPISLFPEPRPRDIAAGTDGAMYFAFGSIGRVVLNTGYPCVYSLPQAGDVLPAAGGSGSTTVRVSTDGENGCRWVAYSTVPWISITSGNPSRDYGWGNGPLSYAVAPNPSPTPRSGVLTVAPISTSAPSQRYVVTQAGTSTTAGCTASVASATQVAIEGRTETLGDYVLNCSGLTAAITADVTLTLNTNVTNALANGVTDAVLTPSTGLFGTASSYNSLVSGYNSLRWPAVLIVPRFDGTAGIRISGVRADATPLLTQRIAAEPGNPHPTAITGRASISAPVPIPLTDAVQTMARASQTVVFTKNPPVPPADGALGQILLVFREATANSFHGASGDTPATRLRINLSNVPAAAQVYVPVYPLEGSLRAQLYSADFNGSGGSPVAGNVFVAGNPFAGAAYQQVTVTGGSATATWVVLAADSAQIETWTFPLLVLNATAADLNRIQLAGSLAPVSDVPLASASAPVPRYRDPSVPQKLANLRVSASIEGTDLAPGSILTFASEIVNDTTDPAQSATNATLQNIFPSGLNYVSCAATQGGTCSVSGNQVVVNYGTLGPGQSVSATVVAQVGAGFNRANAENSVSAASDETNLDLFAATSSTSLILATIPPQAVAVSPGSGTGASWSMFKEYGVVDETGLTGKLSAWVQVALGLPNHQALAGSFYNGFGHLLQGVDFENSFHLGKEAVQ